MRYLFTTFGGTTAVRICCCAALLFCGTLLSAQLSTRSGQLQYLARGTGQTTGKIISLHIYNPTSQTIRTVVGDCFIPSSKNYQGYVVLKTYPVEVPALDGVQIYLEGYCVNVQKQAVPAGETMTDIANWVSWAEGLPLPDPESEAPREFSKISPEQAENPLSLNYPGTQMAFSYKIDFNRHPQASARLLLHVASSAEQAYDQLVKDELLQTNRLGRPARELRQQLIQQTIWAFAAQLEGQAFGKSDFTRQFLEETEQQLNLNRENFPPEVDSLAEQQIKLLWAAVSLTAAGAKLVAPGSEHSDQIFQETFSGSQMNVPELLPSHIDRINPLGETADLQLVAVLLFLKANATSETNARLRQKTLEKWENYLHKSLNKIQTEKPASLAQILEIDGLLSTTAGLALSEKSHEKLREILLVRLNAHLKHQLKFLTEQDADYLAKWRRLKSFETVDWYSRFYSKSGPLKKLRNPKVPESSNRKFAPENIQLAGPQWKVSFVSTPVVSSRKFPWWIPAAAVPVVGGGVYWLLQKKKESLPSPPVAAPDVLNLPCQGSGLANVLANDSGTGIKVTAVTAPAGIDAEVFDASSIQISGAGIGSFTLNYVLTDEVGQITTGMLTLNVGDMAPPVVNCPPALTLEACDQVPTPGMSGEATAVDDCDPSPSVYFVDEMSGTPCHRLFTRTWIGTDATSKSASCEQLITIHDQTAPEFTNCPSAVSLSFGDHTNLDLTGLATATDNCTNSVVPIFSDDNSNVADCIGTILRTWKVADACHNSATCVQMIEVMDNSSPVFTICPESAFVECIDQIDLNSTGIALATDNCAGDISPGYTDDFSNFNGCSGQVIRHWTVSDGAGNSASCDQVIAIADQVPPVFTNCPPALTVNCGQQSNLGITGQAKAEDGCMANVTILFSDDLSQFSDCEGLIKRTWTAIDQCGNVAQCFQSIQVQAAPCDFEPNFTVGPGTCGNCNGTIAVNVLPAGSYSFKWSNGKTGAMVSNLCPAAYSVAIHDPAKSCTEIFKVDVPNVTTLSLRVVGLALPTSPASSDGSIEIEVLPPNATLPVEVFINDMSLGLFGSTNFTIGDLQQGTYSIQVVDGGGCISEVLVVDLFPTPESEKISLAGFPVTGFPQVLPGNLLQQFFEKSQTTPEMPQQDLAGSLFLDRPVGIYLNLNIGTDWQLHWLDQHQYGFFMPENAVLGSARIPVRFSGQQLGLRHFTTEKNQFRFFKETGLAHLQLRSNSVGQSAPATQLNISSDQWQMFIGGGFHYRLLQRFNLECCGQLFFSHFEKKLRLQPALQLRLQIQP